MAYVAGDASAFNELFRRFAPPLKRFLGSRLPAATDANDLLQLTFTQLHCARHDFDSRQNLRGWIFTIALNVKRGHFRRMKRRPEAALDPVHMPAQAAHGQARFEAAHDLAWALAAIPEVQRDVIELHWFADLSFQELAVTLGITLENAKTRAHRGYLALRDLLGVTPANASESQGVGHQVPDSSIDPIAILTNDKTKL